MKILIALDAGPHSIETVRGLSSRPWPAKSQFLLLHVLDPYPYGKMPVSLKRAKDEVSEQLREAAEPLIKAGWKVQTDVILGRARQLIAKLAKSWNADFLLVGSSGEGPLMRVLLGSTARSVLRQAPCSVEIVRARDEEAKAGHLGMKILIATDGSEFSLAALRSVAKRPWPNGSTFRVIAIPEPYMPLGQFQSLELKEIERLNNAAVQEAKKYAQAGAEILQKAGLNAEERTHLPFDSDAREIIKEADQWNPDLIVLGSHGRRGFDRMTIGSVSEHVAFHAKCSVEVIR